MNDFNLTKGQEEALFKLKFWWQDPDRKQVFEISGFAGCGKTFLIKRFIADMNIDINFIAFAAFTGKAALVINRSSGFKALTIHKLCYKPIDVPATFKTVIDENGQIRVLLDKDGNPVIDVPAHVEFIKKEPFEISMLYKLIVIDECSMISEKMWEDLKSFQVPIIVLGDSMQLPPIYGPSPLLKDPDVQLTEVMRQKKDSGILSLATKARNGDWINARDYYHYDDVFVITEDELSDDELVSADIVLCGKNVTRDKLNAKIRNILGYTTQFPSMGEKLICRKNNWNKVLETEDDSVPLVNGLIGYLSDPIDKSTITPQTFNLNFQPEFLKPDDMFMDLKTSTIPFLPNMTKKEKDNQLKYISRDQTTNVFEFAYCITTHLSQGSQWDNVIIFDEWLGDREFHQKWLYTAITRAAKCVILVTKNPGWR